MSPPQKKTCDQAPYWIFLQEQWVNAEQERSCVQLSARVTGGSHFFTHLELTNIQQQSQQPTTTHNNKQQTTTPHNTQHHTHTHHNNTEQHTTTNNNTNNTWLNVSSFVRPSRNGTCHPDKTCRLESCCQQCPAVHQRLPGSTRSSPTMYTASVPAVSSAASALEGNYVAPAPAVCAVFAPVVDYSPAPAVHAVPTPAQQQTNLLSS